MVGEPEAISALVPVSTVSLDERFFKALIDGLTDAVYVVEPSQRNIVYWNKGAEVVFGYTFQEALGLTTDVLHTDLTAVEQVYDVVSPEPEGRVAVRTERECRRRGGEIFPAEVMVTRIQLPVPTSENSHLLVVVRDITERKKAEDQLQALSRVFAERAVQSTSELSSARHDLAEAQAEQRLTAEQFRLLIEGVNDYAILTLDVGGRLMTWNSGATKIFGYREAEVVGRHVSVLHAATERDTEDVSASLERARVGGSSDNRVQLVRKDGSRFSADRAIAPFFDSTGRLTSFSMILRDVTERIAFRQQLQEKERLATIGTTASIFAHEVSNPLNGMSAAIQMFERLLDQPQPPNKATTLSIVNDLKSEIRRLQALLEDFRSLARPATLNLQLLDLRVLIRDLLKGLVVNFAPAKITLTEELPGSLPLINGDNDRLKQALLNLIKNAAEAMPTGGIITVKAHESGGNVCVDVMDTGSGISEGAKIFDFFHTTKPGGTGLGLAIVKQIVTAHNGSITYNSAVGKGTTFHLSFPAAPSGDVSGGQP
jgi:PAS domain S-box-containing protein